MKASANIVIIYKMKKCRTLYFVFCMLAILSGCKTRQVEKQDKKVRLDSFDTYLRNTTTTDKSTVDVKQENKTNRATNTVSVITSNDFTLTPVDNTKPIDFITPNGDSLKVTNATIKVSSKSEKNIIDEQLNESKNTNTTNRNDIKASESDRGSKHTKATVAIKSKSVVSEPSGSLGWWWLLIALLVVILLFRKKITSWVLRKFFT